MTEEKIKQAFQKVKEDMQTLKSRLNEIYSQLQELKRTSNKTDKPTDTQTDTQTHQFTMPSYIQTHQTNIENSQNKSPPEAVKNQNTDISTGNKGVQTDRQTNRQTDRQTENPDYKSFSGYIPNTPSQKFALMKSDNDAVKRIEKVAEVVSSLDSLKSDLRKMFKQLTHQEMLVFSTIYQLTDQAIDVDYSLLSKKTNLSESSIRDYIQKLVKKGAPLEKTKENNKRVLLTIPRDFKRIASLDTILSLRSL